MNRGNRAGAKALVVTVLSAWCAPLAAATPELRPFSASYSMKWNGVSAGTVEFELQRTGDSRWTYQSRALTRRLFRVAMPAELSSRSVFVIENGQVVPQQFTADGGAGSTSKDQQLDFDWSRARVTGSYEGKPVDLPSQPGLLDSLSVQVALMNELVSGRTPQRFVLVDKGRIKDYLYTTEGTETLRTEVGEYRTVIYRSSRPGSKNSTWFWCAPELGYMPLKVERREGKSVELLLAVRTMDVASPR